MQQSHQKACPQAAKQNGLPVATFPEDCPYSIELVLDENWLPE